jgi:ADP-ribose pyrophosphatase YjhB (NUDIX family)
MADCNIDVFGRRPDGRKIRIGRKVKLELSAASKEAIAHLGRKWPFDWLIALAVRFGVARHRVGVALVAFDANGRVLLLRHVLHAAYPWGLPGGWLNRNEAPANGLARELREETGLEIVLGPTILVDYGKYPPHIVIIYLGWLRPGAIRLSHEINEARWFAPDDLPHPLSYFAKQAIRSGLTLWKSTPNPLAANHAVKLRGPVAGTEVRPIA